MISNQFWVGAVDHRISAAIVFFVLMLLLLNVNAAGMKPFSVIPAAFDITALCPRCTPSKSPSATAVLLPAAADFVI